MTRVQAMQMAIREMEKKRRNCSRNRNGLIPLDGMEEEFAKANEAILTLREIYQGMLQEGKQKSLAAWQENIIENPEAVRLAMSDFESR